MVQIASNCVVGETHIKPLKHEKSKIEIKLMVMSKHNDQIKVSLSSEESVDLPQQGIDILIIDS